MIKRIIIISVSLLLIALFLVSGFLFARNKSQDFSPASFLGKIARQETVRKAAGKLKAFIYQEATVYNPEGDVLPDGIDDELFDEIKDKLK